MGRNARMLGVLVFTLAVFASLQGLAQAATTYTVNTEADNPAVVGECSGLPLDCSIRQALDKSVDGDTVSIPAGHYILGSQLNVGNDISIIGTGNPVIDGGHAVRVFSIGGSGTATSTA